MRLMMRSVVLVSSVLLSMSVFADDKEASKEDQMKILEAVKGFGCSEIQGETEDEGSHFEVDDLICNGYSYDLQIDKDMKVITMVRDPAA